MAALFNKFKTESQQQQEHKPHDHKHLSPAVPATPSASTLEDDSNSKFLEVTLTPENVDEFLAKKPCAWQRPFNKSKAKAYSNDMARDSWNQSASLLHEAELPDGSRILLDGQKRLWAVRDSGTTQRFLLVTHKVKDKDEAKEIYSKIDLCEPRKRGDSLSALGIGETWEGPKNLRYKFAAAIYVIHREIMGNRAWQTIEDAERLIKNHKYDKLFYNLYQIFKNANKDVYKVFIGRAPVTAISMLLLENDTVNATRFLTEIAEERAPIGTTTNTIRNFLTSNKASGGGNRIKEFSRGVPKYIFMRAVLMAYEAFMDNKQLESMTVKTVKAHGSVSLKIGLDIYAV